MDYKALLFLALSPLIMLGVKGQCNTGDLCLADGSGNHEGRVQVCNNGAWGTVCDDSWSTSDAVVVCRQLGYSTTGATALSFAHFGAGTGAIVMDDVVCTGAESQLTSCSHITSHNCGHSEDASVQCSTARLPQSSGICYTSETYTDYITAYRIVSTTGYTACGFLWLSRCSKIIYKTVAVQEPYTATRCVPVCCNGYTGDGQACTPICSAGCGNGVCVRPGECACNTGWTGPTCTTELCPGREGAARLAGGTSLSGRVELCVGGEWGTVCDDYWDNNDASVACYQLGFSRYNAIGMRFGSAGTGPIHMDNVHCIGSESTLFECLHYVFHDCSHYEDAGVTCHQRLCGDGAVRLVGSGGVIGTNVRKGRIELCINETWGTVCDQSWSREDAKVVCGQLGFLQSGASRYTDAFFGQGTGPILLNDVGCTGSESTLLDCISSPIGTIGSCSHVDDAGVSCRTSLCSNGELSLVEGLSANEGRLEVCYNSQWGTVCDDNWTQGSTNVACRQLGVQESTNAVRLTNNIFGMASSGVPILLDDVACTGSEATLLSCPRRPIGQDDCGHSEDISLRCGECSEGDVRLANGASHNEGRVEVCLSGRWGTVCDDGWSVYDAQVTCQQLGYTTTGATALSGSSFTPTFSLPIVMDGVACYGIESRLIDCTYEDAQNLQYCSHTEDARLRCTLSLPGSPQNFITQSVTATSITKVWGPPTPSVPPSAAVTRYSITCSAPGKPSRSAQTANSAITSVTITGLSPYTYYSCCVVAESLVGAGASNCHSSWTSETAPSGPPLSIRVVPATSRSISVSWQEPLVPNGVIREYRLLISEPATSIDWQLTSTSLVQQVTGLHPYTIYTVRVAAVTVSVGPYSSVIQAKTFSDVPDAAPSVPASSEIARRSFRLTWQPPPQENWNGILTYYEIRLDNQRTGNVTYYTVPASPLSFIATSLIPNTVYDCSVAALTVNGTGPYSSEHSVQTSEDVPSTSPLLVRHKVLSSTKLVVQWSPPNSQDQNGEIHHYSLELNDTIGVRTVIGTSHTVFNLHPYYIYNYRVAAFTVALGPYSQWRSVRMPPASPSGPPLNFRAVQQQLTSITVAWQPPSSFHQNGVITNYTVHITPLEASPYTLATTGLSLTAAFLVANSVYSFSVAASTEVGIGPYTSPSLSLRTLPPAVTSAPRNVSLLVLDHERLLVTWTDPPTSEQSGTITGYMVIVIEVKTERSWENSTNLPRLTITNLHPYYSYQVKVRAVPDSGSGLYSASVTATTLPKEPGGAPNITNTNTTSRSILLQWIPPPEDQHNGIITGYIIRILEDGVEKSVSVAAHVLEYTFEALPFTQYLLSIAAVNSVGMGPFGAITEVRSQEDVPTHHPRHLMGMALSSTSIILTWDPPPEDHHHGEIDSYTVLCTDVNSGGSLSEHATAVTNITITGLHPFYTYKCNVSAVTVGYGPFSDTTDTTTLEDAPSGPPLNLTVTGVGPDSVSLSWVAPNPWEQNGIIRHYLIHAQPINLFSLSHRTPSSYTSHNISGLKPFTLYHISVAAVTIATGPTSDTVEVHTSEDIPSDSPLSVTLTALSPHSLLISWKPPPTDSQNGHIRYYTVKIVEDNSMTVSLTNTSDNVTSLTVNQLHPYYQYSVSVAAVSIGMGPFSPEKSIRMPEAAPSGQPQDVRGIARSAYSIEIQWRPPPTEQQNGEIVSYTVLCLETDTEGTLSRQTTSATDIIITGLHPYYTYTCNVSAGTVDEGPFSQNISVTTLEDVPSAPPYNIVVENIGERNVTLSWTEPSVVHHNGVIRNYLIYVTPRQTWLLASRHITPSPQLFYTVQDLHPHSDYTINVAAVTIGPGQNSSDFHTQTNEDAPSSAPLELSAIPLSPQSLSISWKPPPNELINGELRSYSVRVMAVATRNVTFWMSALPTITIGPLHPSYSYLVSVAATTVKQGPYTTEIKVTMLEAEPSGPPEVTVSDVMSDAIRLHIVPPAEQDQNGVITGYIIEYSSSRNNTNVSVKLNSTEYTSEAHPYTIYTLRVAAVNSAGHGPFSKDLHVQTLQDAPSSKPKYLLVGTVTTSSIQLSWESPPSEDHNGVIVSYTVICLELESDGIMREYSSTTTNITVTDLHPYYRYSCRVSAVTVSLGPFSDHINITTLEDAPSGHPYNLTVLDITPYSLSISWNPPHPSQWNGVIRNYLVHVTPIVSLATTITYVTPSSSNSYTITGLSPYTFHQITVAAVTIAPGPNSTTMLIKTAEDIPSAPPQDLIASPISSSELSLTWRPPPQEHQHGLIRYYSVIVIEVTTGSKTVYTTPDNSPHFIVGSLHPHYVYHIGVKAATIGLSHFTQEVTVHMPEEAPSSPPFNLTITAKGSSYVLLQWLPPLDTHHNGEIRHYIISLKNGSSFETIKNLTSTSAQPSINIGGLQPDTAYSCSVSAVTVAPSPFSTYLTFNTDADIPGTVQLLVAFALSSRSMNVSWQPPLSKEIAEQIDHYQISVTHVGGFEYVTTTPLTSLVVNSLHPNYIYQCSVTYKTNSGIGPFSHVLLQLPPEIPTSHPQNVTAVPSDASTLHIYWSPPPPDKQNGDIMKYGINITDVESGQTSQYYTSGPQTSVIVRHLSPHMLYQYSIAATTAIGNGPFSPSQTIRMPSAAPSSAPMNFSVAEIGSSYALLRWSPPPKDDHNGVIQHYRVYLNTSQGATVILSTASSETHILLNSLRPNTNYSCKVAAATVSPGPKSTVLHFTTNSTAPETIQSLTATVISSQSVNISWQPPLSEHHIVDYAVTLTSLYRDNNKSRHSTTVTRSIVMTMLDPGTFYLCTVAARTIEGLQQPVSILVRLPPDIPSGYPRDIVAVVSGPRTLHLTWSPPALDEQNGFIVQYGINITDIQNGEFVQFTVRDYATSLTIPDLHPYYYYNYTVTAFTLVGNGPYSPTGYIQMPEDAPDASPVGVTVTNVSPGVVILQWLPPPDDKHNGDITGYVIRIVNLEQLIEAEEMEVDDVTSKIISDLKTSHAYNFSVSAKNIAGLGPFSHSSSILTLHGVPFAPVGVRAGRISATQIRVSWPLLTVDAQTHSTILYYTIKYYSVDGNSQLQRDLKRNVQSINTTKNVTLNGLDPTQSYRVAVAVNTVSGRGNFSEEITIRLSENSLFQLFLSGAIDCQQWILYHTDAKLKSMREALSLELEEMCQCKFPADYILLYQPNCLSAHTDWLILSGRIVGTNLTSSANILNNLQQWSDMESKVVVEGVHLTSLNFCPVLLNEGEPPYCETPTLIVSESISGGNESESFVTNIIVGVVVTMMMMILVVLVCILTVSCYRKKKVQERHGQFRFHSTHPLHTFDNPSISSSSGAAKCSKEDSDSNIYEQADSIYESILDNESPYTELPSNPPPVPNLPTMKAKPVAAEPPHTTDDSPEGYSRTQFFDSQRCPSPVDYSVLKPNNPAVMECNTYEAVKKKASQLESVDDYVPMFNEDSENPTAYENMTSKKCEQENDYQVPRPQEELANKNDKKYGYQVPRPETKAEMSQPCYENYRGKEFCASKSVISPVD